MLKHDTAKPCYESIRDADLSKKLQPLRRDFYDKAINYALIRTQWQLSSREQRNVMDQRRTLAHNAFIDACNIPAVAEGAARVLSKCKEGWAREAIEESFIDDNIKAELLG
jgi:hypothetical protein